MALSTMSFTDITYSLPRANIFSDLELCLAVVPASIPLMRLLLGHFVYTPETSTRPSKFSDPSPGTTSNSDSGSQPLDAEKSQLWMRLMGIGSQLRHRNSEVSLSERSKHRERANGQKHQGKMWIAMRKKLRRILH